ncbi:hypothetical protein CP8484711_2020B, partial [Chlamydia psittaci 84-8471/1]
PRQDTSISRDPKRLSSIKISVSYRKASDIFAFSSSSLCTSKTPILDPKCAVFTNIGKVKASEILCIHNSGVLFQACKVNG